MRFDLQLNDSPNQNSRSISTTLLTNINPNAKVFLLYFPGSKSADNVTECLQHIGAAAEGNLHVHIGSIGDPLFQIVVGRFEIIRLPCIIVFKSQPSEAISDASSFYVRLDGPSLLSSPDSLRVCIDNIFTAFIANRLHDAEAVAANSERSTKIRNLGDWLAQTFSSLASFIATRDIVVSLFEGSVSIKKHSA